MQLKQEPTCKDLVRFRIESALGVLQHDMANWLVCCCVDLYFCLLKVLLQSTFLSVWNIQYVANHDSPSILYLWVFLSSSALKWLSIYSVKGIRQTKKIIADRLQQLLATIAQLSLHTMKECSLSEASDGDDRMSGNHLDLKLNPQGHLSSFLSYCGL